MSPQKQFGRSACRAAMILCSHIGGIKAMTRLTLDLSTLILTVITVIGPVSPIR